MNDFMFDIVVEAIFPLLLGILSTFLVFLGGKLLVTKRPFLISCGWMRGMVTLAFAPALVLPVVTLLDAPDPPLFMLLQPAMILTLLVFVWIQMRGYVVLGTTEETLQSALDHAMGQLGHEYEQKLSSVHVPALDAKIQMSIQSWIGVAQIKPANARAKQITEGLSSAMGSYFAKHEVAPQMTTGVFYILIGVLTAAVTLGIAMA